MKLFQLSWFLAMLSYVILGVFRRAGPFVESMSPGVQVLAVLLLSLLPAGIGVVLGVMSWNRKEAKSWWVIGVIVMNTVMVFAGILYLS